MLTTAGVTSRTSGASVGTVPPVRRLQSVPKPEQWDRGAEHDRERDRNKSLHPFLPDHATRPACGAWLRGRASQAATHHAAAWLIHAIDRTAGVSMVKVSAFRTRARPPPWRADFPARRIVTAVEPAQGCENICQAERVTHARNVTQAGAGFDRKHVGRPG